MTQAWVNFTKNYPSQNEAQNKVCVFKCVGEGINVVITFWFYRSKISRDTRIIDAQDSFIINSATFAYNLHRDSQAIFEPSVGYA